MAAQYTLLFEANTEISGRQAGMNGKEYASVVGCSNLHGFKLL